MKLISTQVLGMKVLTNSRTDRWSRPFWLWGEALAEEIWGVLKLEEAWRVRMDGLVMAMSLQSCCPEGDDEVRGGFARA
jgi:hypothetical protein